MGIFLRVALVALLAVLAIIAGWNVGGFVGIFAGILFLKITSIDVVYLSTLIGALLGAVLFPVPIMRLVPRLSRSSNG
jgi:hypothetical protein